MKYLAFFLGITENHTEVTALVRTNVWLNIKDNFEVIEIFFFVSHHVWNMAKSAFTSAP